MPQYELKARTIALLDGYEVVVVGGGPAGCAAATAAAREGARTLLIEATGCLGGMGTAGLVPAWCPFSDKKQIIYKGLAEKVFLASKAGMPHVNPNAVDWVPIDPEHLKRVYDDLVTEAGVEVLFHTVLSAVETDDAGRVSAVILSNKGGLVACRAKVFVDCTGDGDLAAWAGAPYEMADPATLQPATHCFTLSNVDEYAYRTGGRFHGRSTPDSTAKMILDSGRYPLILDTHACNDLVAPRTVGFNAGHIWEVDNTNPASVSRALVLGRKIAKQYRDGLAEFSPRTFGNAHLAATGSLMGVRETRRITGDYVLTVEDYLARRSFPDEICRNAYYLDVHRTADENKAELAGRLDLETRTHRYNPGESHGVPYRCLTPKGLLNVLVAGRSISADRSVLGSVRVMPVCLCTGEAAGLAAAMATQQTLPDVHAVDSGQLRRRLREHGAYLPDVE